jgi:FrmR/RcnR family transcriptional regulator, repressor of frmRAB operon
MAHTVREKAKLVQRVRRIRGQVEALERAVSSEQDCWDVLQLLAAARGAMNSLMAEVLEGHIRFHVIDHRRGGNSERALAAEQLIEVVHSYLK